MLSSSCGRIATIPDGFAHPREPSRAFFSPLMMMLRSTFRSGWMSWRRNAAYGDIRSMVTTTYKWKISLNIKRLTIHHGQIYRILARIRESYTSPREMSRWTKDQGPRKGMERIVPKKVTPLPWRSTRKNCLIGSQLKLGMDLLLCVNPSEPLLGRGRKRLRSKALRKCETREPIPELF